MLLVGFLRVRHYLAVPWPRRTVPLVAQEVSSRMLWIDPQLCSNEDLEAALIDWESAWVSRPQRWFKTSAKDLGVTFLKPELCQALCGIATEVAKNPSASQGLESHG